MMEGHILYWCDFCGTELYEGSFCYCLEGQRVCPECLKDYAKKFFQSCLEQVK